MTIQTAPPRAATTDRGDPRVGEVAPDRTTLGRRTVFARRLFLPLVTLAGFLLYAARRPDAFLNAQFLAEDGTLLYLDALLFPAAETWLAPATGYLFVAERALASLVALAPPRWAPLAMAAVASLSHVLCVVYLASSRFAPLVPSGKLRAGAVLAVLALPAIYEVHASLGNLQWFLAILITLIAITPPTRQLRISVAEAGLLLLAGVSSFTMVLLSPLFVARAVVDRGRHSALLASAAVGATALQLATHAQSSRAAGAYYSSYFSMDLVDAAAVTIYRVIGGAMLGSHATDVLQHVLGWGAPPDAQPIPAQMILFLLTLTMTILVSAWSLPPRLRWPLLYLASVPAAGAILVYQGRVPSGISNLAALWNVNVGARYYTGSVAAVVLLVVAGLAASTGRRRYLALIPAVFLAFAVATSFLLDRRTDFNWRRQAACLETILREGGRCEVHAGIGREGGNRSWQRVVRVPARDEPLELLANARAIRALWGGWPSEIRAGQPVTLPTLEPASLTAGDVVLNANTRALVRLDESRGPVRLIGKLGQRVHVSNLGEWDATSRSLTGLDAIYTEDERWGFARVPSVTPSGIPGTGRGMMQILGALGLVGQGATDDPLEALKTSAGATVTALRDELGPYVRVEATRPTRYLALSGQGVLANLDDAPATVRARIRASGAGVRRLMIMDVGSDGVRREYVDETKPGDDWAFLQRTVPAITGPHPDDSFAVGLVDAEAGDWIEVRDFGLFVGVLPR